MASPTSDQPPSSKQVPSKGLSLLSGVGLIAIALPSFYALSTLLFATLGLAPSSPNWPLALVLAGFLALSGAAIGLQTHRPNQPNARFTRPLATLGSFPSGAILGLFTGGQLSEQSTLWAVVGLGIGGLGLSAIAFFAYGRQRRRFWQRAIAIINGLCAYTLAFSLGAWTWMALDTGKPGLALLLGGLSALYLRFTRNALALCFQRS